MSNNRDIWESLKPTTIQDDYEDTLLYNIRDTFDDNLYKETIYKNYDYATSYKMIISSGDKDSKLDGAKRIWSYPYDTVQFNSGDYIHWDSNTWLITSIDNERIYEVYGEIIECTQTLKRYNNDGELVSKESPFIMIKGGSETIDKDILTGTGTRVAYLPLDDDVSEWITEHRINEKMSLFYIPNEKAVYNC